MEPSALGISRAYDFFDSHAKVLRCPHRTLQNFEALIFYLSLFFFSKLFYIISKKGKKEKKRLVHTFCHKLNSDKIIFH